MKVAALSAVIGLALLAGCKNEKTAFQKIGPQIAPHLQALHDLREKMDGLREGTESEKFARAASVAHECKMSGEHFDAIAGTDDSPDKNAGLEPQTYQALLELIGGARDGSSELAKACASGGALGCLPGCKSALNKVSAPATRLSTAAGRVGVTIPAI